MWLVKLLIAGWQKTVSSLSCHFSTCADLKPEERHDPKIEPTVTAIYLKWEELAKLHNNKIRSKKQQERVAVKPKRSKPVVKEQEEKPEPRSWKCGICKKPFTKNSEKSHNARSCPDREEQEQEQEEQEQPKRKRQVKKQVPVDKLDNNLLQKLIAIANQEPVKHERHRISGGMRKRLKQQKQEIEELKRQMEEFKKQAVPQDQPAVQEPVVVQDPPAVNQEDPEVETEDEVQKGDDHKE